MKPHRPRDSQYEFSILVFVILVSFFCLDAGFVLVGLGGGGRLPSPGGFVPPAVLVAFIGYLFARGDSFRLDLPGGVEGRWSILATSFWAVLTMIIVGSVAAVRFDGLVSGYGGVPAHLKEAGSLVEYFCTSLGWCIAVVFLSALVWVGGHSSGAARSFAVEAVGGVLTTLFPLLWAGSELGGGWRAPRMVIVGGMVGLAPPLVRTVIRWSASREKASGVSPGWAAGALFRAMASVGLFLATLLAFGSGLVLVGTPVGAFVPSAFLSCLVLGWLWWTYESHVEGGGAPQPGTAVGG